MYVYVYQSDVYRIIQLYRRYTNSHTQMYPCTCTSVGVCMCIHVCTFTLSPSQQRPHQSLPLSPPDPSRTPRPPGGGASGESQSEPREARTMGGAGKRGRAGRGYMGRGLLCPGSCSASGAPNKHGGYLHSGPARPMGGRLARVPGRRRGQLRRHPRWRWRGAAVSGRCCRAQRRRGRALPRQGARHLPRLCHPVPGHPLVLGRCILLGAKKRTLWSVSSGFSVSAYGVGTGSLHRPACPS